MKMEKEGIKKLKFQKRRRLLNCSIPPTKKKNDMICNWCNLKAEHSNLLEIHMISCVQRKPKVKNPDCDSGLEARISAGMLKNRSSKPFGIPNRNSKNGNFHAVDCQKTIVSQNFSRQRNPPTSYSLKHKKVKLKINTAKNKVNGNQADNPNPTIAISEEALIYKKTHERSSHEVDPPSDKLFNVISELSPVSNKMLLGNSVHKKILNKKDKLYKSPVKIALRQRPEFKSINAETGSDKLKKNNLQKYNLKTPRPNDEKRQTAKKKDHSPAKSNSSTETVLLRLLLNAMPENDSGMFLVSSSTNKIDPNYRCSKCGKAFRSIKLGSMHFLDCKSTKLLNNEVSVNDVRWVCTICYSPFVMLTKLMNHLKGCNIFAKNYEKVCEKQCSTCHFKCISSFLFDKHNCSKEINKLKSCRVKINKVTLKPTTASRLVMIECEFCSEIVDEQLTVQHFRSCHPGKSSNGNIRPIYVNLNPQPTEKPACNETVVVKSEPIDNTYDSPDLQPSYNQSCNNVSVPPSSVNLPTYQTSKEATSSHLHSVADSTRILNQQICKCLNRKVTGDVKPCLKCLSKLQITKFAQKFNILPFKIKQETSEDSQANNSGNAATSVAENAGDMAEIETRGLLQLFHDFEKSFSQSSDYQSTLTPPSSHTGLTPPLTPATLMQSATALASEEPCSSDVCMDDLSLEQDMAQLDEPRCPDDLVHYINDDLNCSTDMPLMSQYDSRELFAPVESCKITHTWEADVDTTDVYAIVTSDEDETVKEYICSQCFYSCSEQQLLIKHFYDNHGKKSELLAMFISKTRNESLEDSAKPS